MPLAKLSANLAGATRQIADVMRDWHVAECSDLFRDMSARAMGAEFTGSAALLGDAVRGGTTLDHIDRIPKAVQAAFHELMGVSPGNYDDMKALLQKHLTETSDGQLSFTSRAAVGFISKVKGQIGENVFTQHLGSSAMLAESGSQAGWDVAIRQSDDAFQYVQVKLYGSASGVVQHMRSVQEKVLAGAYTGANGEPVRQIVFAVPKNIHAEVQRLVGDDPALAGMLYETPVPINADQAAQLVKDGMTNVSQGELTQFFNQLLGGAVIAGSLHAAVNAFLWYKGSKEFADAVADTVTDTAVSTVGIAACLVAEHLCRTVIVAGAVGIGVRLFLGQMTRSRWDFADFLDQSLCETRAHIDRLKQLASSSPAA
jgi:hypothetical protein